MNVNANELGDQVLALPAAERILLAQRLWDSLHDEERGALIGDESETLQLVVTAIRKTGLPIWL